MACDGWSGKIDLYLDGELSHSEASALGAHLKGCAACAAAALERVQMKRSVALAGTRYQPGAQFRSKVTQSVAAKPASRMGWQWKIVIVPAVLVLVVSLAVNWYRGREGARRQHLYSELADLHVTTLASAAPVDVLSTDRHTVKPWFQGRIPFTFNLPETQNTEFTLLGGKVAYLAQRPGAQLVYQLRKHEISVFIFQDRGDEAVKMPPGAIRALSFTVETWTQNGLRYFVVGDVSSDDMQALSKFLRAAG